MDWSALYPSHFTSKTATERDREPLKSEDGKDAQVEFADIGCGYGGLLGEKRDIEVLLVTGSLSCSETPVIFRFHMELRIHMPCNWLQNMLIIL